jgi:hypothetical protein
MKRILSLFGLALLFSSSSLSAVIRELPRPHPRKIVLITIPKSGTHLLQKAVRLITGQPVEMLSFADVHALYKNEIELDPNDGIISWQHLFPQLDCIKEDKEHFIKIINIRDPRDILVSQIDWHLTMGMWASWTPQGYIQKFATLSQDEQLSEVINFPQNWYSVKRFAKKALEWMKEPDVFVCRFEDLVGPQGGGSRIRQEKVIRDLATHLGYSIEEEDIFYIADNIFGDSYSFRKGQIGRWHEFFKPKHVEEFKKTMGKLLIKLDYEKNLNW